LSDFVAGVNLDRIYHPPPGCVTQTAVPILSLSFRSVPRCSAVPPEYGHADDIGAELRADWELFKPFAARPVRGSIIPAPATLGANQRHPIWEIVDWALIWTLIGLGPRFSTLPSQSSKKIGSVLSRRTFHMGRWPQVVYSPSCVHRALVSHVHGG